MKVNNESEMRTGEGVLAKIRHIDDIQKIVTILFISMILSAALSFWPLVFAILGMIIALEAVAFVMGLMRKSSEKETDRENREMNENDVIDIAFDIAMKRITQFLRINFPVATWTFECSRPKLAYANKRELYITLSNACGYKRAQVMRDGLFVTGIRYETAASEKTDVHDEVPDEKGEMITEEAETAQSCLPAVKKWIENNINLVSDRISSALTQKRNECLLESSILPENRTWDILAHELSRHGLVNAEKSSRGIMLHFNV